MTLKVLISAYSIEPDRGSESGAGYSIVRAAARFSEVWVFTRANNVETVQKALEADPPQHPIHLIPLELSERALALKRRYNAVRSYYALWQRRLAREAARLDEEVGGFSLVHHATMSAFWLPIGVSSVSKPLVIGPISGGTFTPRSLLGQLGPRGLAKDSVRMVNAHIAAMTTRETWRRARVVMVQNREMEIFARRHLSITGEILVQSHASSPPLSSVSTKPAERSPLVLFIGRLVTWKGILLALDAFEQVDLDSARMIFVGDGPDRALLLREIRRRGLVGTVEVPGSLPRQSVLDMMRRASCLLFPSFHDSAGFVVSEALTLGLPVVCLDHGGPGELTRVWSGTPSVSVKPGSSEHTATELAASVRRFIVDPVPIAQGLVPADVDIGKTVRNAYQIALREQSS